MNEMARQGDKLITLQQISKETGASYRTVAAYAQKAGWTENGKQTLLDNMQATIIVEAMKQAHAGGPNNGAGTLQTSLQGIETPLTPLLQMELLQREKDAINDKIQAIKDAEIERLKQQAAADAPKVGYYEALVDRNHLTNFRDTAKEIGIPEKKFISVLEEKGYIYRDSRGRIKPYHDKMEYFAIKDWENSEFTGTQTFITVIGKQHFLRLFGNPLFGQIAEVSA
jgi:phage antirepressor YoqD-like protein